MFKHEKQLFHPVAVERQIPNTPLCFRNSWAAATAN